MKDPELKTKIQQLQIIAAAMIFCPFVYVGIIWFLKQSDGFEATSPEMVPMLTGVLAFAFLSQIGFAKIFPSMRKASGADENWFSAYRNVSIVQFALYESGAVFGLLLGFMGAEFMVTVAFCAASLFFLLTAFPTEDRVRRAKRRR